MHSQALLLLRGLAALTSQALAFSVRDNDGDLETFRCGSPLASLAILLGAFLNRR